MHPSIRHLGKRLICASLNAACAAGLFAGCATVEPEKPHRPIYNNIGLRPNLPPYLKDTVLERTDLSNIGPLAISSFGLVVNLRYSGDGIAPTLVREWMSKEMYRHGIGSPLMPVYGGLSPERVLADKRTAIVTVGAYVPPGARKGQRVDAVCQALPQSNTASLAGGMLYQSDLRLMGANSLDPGGAVNKLGEARGPLFINPAYALETPQPSQGAARAGARTATVMGGAILTMDRPVQLRLRTPQWNISRAIEQVINTRFQGVADKPRVDGKGTGVAEAQDEGYLNLYVPMSYRGNWEHFSAVATHLYINLNPAVAALKAKELADATKLPGALLQDISYALEGIGPAAIPYIQPLLSDPSPDIRYAVARAGAYLGDIPSEDALIKIASTEGHPFRLNAILALGELPNNPEINLAMMNCLDSDQTLIRVNAYKVLAASGDAHVSSRKIGQNFVLDVIDSKGPPLIYATRSGEPRLAIFGSKTSLHQPITFAAFDTQLTIMTNIDNPKLLSVFYRGDELQQPVSTVALPVLFDLTARLGGAGDEKLHFSYGDIVGILQSLADSGKISAAFVLQDQPGIEDALNATPDASGGGRVVDNPATRASTDGMNTAPPKAHGAPNARPN
jgi:hypothetical protein